MPCIGTGAVSYGNGGRNAQSALQVLTYLPGTRSHDRDFSMIAGPLSRFLRFHPEVELRITGPLNCRLDVPPRQVRHGDKVAFANYHQQFDGIWVNLAPLEDDTVQCLQIGIESAGSQLLGYSHDLLP